MNTENNIFDGWFEKKILIFQSNLYHKLKRNLLKTRSLKVLRLMS